MRTRLISLLGFMVPTLLGRWGEAQDERSGNPPAVPSPGPRYFGRPIDFWKAGLSFEKDNEPKVPATDQGPGKVRVRENVWAQPIQTPDGSWVVYVPPPAVLNFLENPTPDTAKAYVAWKAKQAETLKRALALLEEVKRESSGKFAEVPQMPRAPSIKDEAPAVPLTILYFHQKTCPHCVAQDTVLEKWMKAHPEAHLEVVEPGEKAELWKVFQVKGTPTLVLRTPGGQDPAVLVGLQTEERLDAAVKAVRSVSAGPPPNQKSERKE